MPVLYSLNIRHLGIICSVLYHIDIVSIYVYSEAELVATGVHGFTVHSTVVLRVA